MSEGAVAWGVEEEEVGLEDTFRPAIDFCDETFPVAVGDVIAPPADVLACWEAGR